MSWQEFFEKRRLQALDVLKPDEANDNPGYPFDDPSYTWASMLENSVDPSEYRRWSNSKPEDLVSADPLSENTATDMSSVWDAVLGIPASKLRGNKVYTAKTVPVFRTINDTWQNKTYFDLNKIGRTSPDSEYRRPSGDWILDVVSDKKGWWILELAHMLAHRLEDAAELAKRPLPYSYGQNATLFQTMLFKVFLCRKFGLPLDTLPGADCSDNDPFQKYGIEISVSPNLRNPMLRIPVNGKNSLKPGTTCVVCGSVHIEPTPYAMASGSDRWLAVNRWSCHPTIVSFVGWELADVVTHAPLIGAGKYGYDEYAMPPMTLQESSSFKYFLECAEYHRGKCKLDGRFRLVDEYIDSDDFMEDLSESPPLPCKRCMRLNMESEGSPSRPKSERPEKPINKDAILTQDQREWLEWDNNMNKVLGIVEKATKYMEIRELGAGKAVRFRKTRKSAYSKKVNNLRRSSYLKKKAEKLRKNGFITKAEELENKIEELTNEIEGT